MEDQTISLYGGTYTGELFNSVPSGLGAWAHPDGHAYIGKWINGDFNGHVAVTLDGGSTYVGSCRHDQFFRRTPDGLAQPGQSHIDRVFHGQGTLTDPGGGTYFGEWRLGNPWNGTRWDKDGVVTEKYSEGAPTPIFPEQKLRTTDKKKSFSARRFFFIGAPGFVGWLLIAWVLFVILLLIGSNF